MNVFLDARMFYHSGIGRYGRNLYRELYRLNPSCKITLGTGGQVFERLNEEIDWQPDAIAFTPPIYSLREQVRGSYLCNRYRRRFDLFHFPHYNIPWLSDVPLVVTCHDLIHLLFPQYFTKHKVVFARSLLKRAVRQAKIIITVSEHTRQDLSRFFPQAENKSRVVYHGVDKDFKPLSEEDVLRFKEQQKIDDFLLYVGNCKPHKNLSRLIMAYVKVKSQYRGLKLVILSQTGYNKDVAGAILKAGVERDVVWCQTADTHDLTAYYNAARLLLFPSLYEGFGLPPLEAMACGTPVVASNVSSIPEVVGDAAILVEPDDVDSIAAGIEQGLSDSGLRERLRLAGLKRAKGFSWGKTAEETWRIYQEVAGRE